MNAKSNRLFLLLIVSLILLFAAFSVGITRYCQQLHTTVARSVYSGIWTVSTTINDRVGSFADVDSAPQAQQKWAEDVYPGVLLAYETLSAAYPNMKYLDEADASLSAEEYTAVYEFLRQAEAEMQAACGDTSWKDAALKARTIQNLSDFSAVFEFVPDYPNASANPYCFSAVYYGMEQFYAKEGRYALYTELPN